MDNEDTKELIQWHAGFRGAIKTELTDSKDFLRYEDEKSVGKKELKIDLLIIKKIRNTKIINPIGHIFKKHNILEYKNPDDYLSINDFYKVYAYACLYKAEEDKSDPIGFDDLTISFILNHFPRKMMKHLNTLKDYKIKQYQTGIYHIIGDNLPIQVIITSKLNDKEHKWLNILTNKVTKRQISNVLSDYKISSKDTDKDAVIDIVTKVNKRLIKEWKEEIVMSNELRKLFEPEIKMEVQKELQKEVQKELQKEVQKTKKITLELSKIIQIRKKLQKEYDLITISDHLELDIEYVKKITDLIRENPNETDEGIVNLIQD